MRRKNGSDTVGRAWTRQEDQILLDGVGVFAIHYFERKLQRTRASIFARMRRLFGHGRMSRGAYTLARVARETGYTNGQILRAQRALHQKWKRLDVHGCYLITWEQLQDMVAWLQHDYWCSKLRLYGCLSCGTTRRPSRGRGLCPRCYFQARRALLAAGLPTDHAGLLAWAGTREGTDPGVRMVVGDLRKGRGPTLRHIEWILLQSKGVP